MVFAFAGLSTITSFLADMARDTLAAGWDTPCRGAPAEPRCTSLIAGAQLAAAVRAVSAPRAGVASTSREGGFVLAANHNSNFDPWPLGLTLFPKRYLRFMGKSELFLTPLKQIRDGRGRVPGAPRTGGSRRRWRRRRSSAARGTSSSCSRRARGARRGCGRSTRRARTPARRGSRSRRTCRSSRPGSSAPTGSAASRSCGSRTARRSRSTTSPAREDAPQVATERLMAAIDELVRSA